MSDNEAMFEHFTTPVYIGDIGDVESLMRIVNVEYGYSLKEDQIIFLWEQET